MPVTLKETSNSLFFNQWIRKSMVEVARVGMEIIQGGLINGQRISGPLWPSGNNSGPLLLGQTINNETIFEPNFSL